VTETSRQTLTRSSDGKQLSHDYSYSKDVFKDGKRINNKEPHPALIWLPKIFMLIIFLAVAYYTVKVSKCE